MRRPTSFAVVVLTALLLGGGLLLLGRSGWGTLALVAFLLGVFGGPILLALVLARRMPGGEPATITYWASAAGLGAALVGGFVLRGGLWSSMLGLLAGIFIVVPTYLVAYGVLVWGLLPPATGLPLRSRPLLIFALVSGLATWTVPIGYGFHLWDVNRSKAWCERLAAVVREEKARTGAYPADAKALFARAGPRPYILWSEGGPEYFTGPRSAVISFSDETEMFAGYELNVGSGKWSHWVD